MDSKSRHNTTPLSTVNCGLLTKYFTSKAANSFDYQIFSLFLNPLL